jgi:UPF0755 protein
VRRVLRWLAAVLLLLIIAAAAGVYVVRERLAERHKQWTTEDVFVDIPPGLGPPAIGRRLVEAGVVRDELTFRAALMATGKARELKAGEYRFEQPMTPVEVVEKIARGDVYRRSITFREGLTLKETAEVFEKHGLGGASSFLDAARNPAAIADLDPDAADLEGYLFPETYALPRGTPASELVGLMVDYFKRAFDEPLRALAREQGLTVRQVVTLASLIEKETARPEERPLVAAVYRNRLKMGMGMQADPTIIYALQRAGRYDGNLSREDLQFDSPYNTYRYAGLPPGPIASPGRASLEAAVKPADVKYLYFVSRNDGSHVFAETLEQHNRNVAEWQVKYFRDRRNQGMRE